jgi:hypothetical protein
MINAGEVVERHLALPSPGPAKSNAYSMQLNVESEIKIELDKLVASGALYRGAAIRQCRDGHDGG